MNFESKRLLWVFLLVAIGLNGLFALQFLGDPLGRAPVLDAQENLAWATTIAEGALPAEPFYRALLYPWVLSLFSGWVGNLAVTATMLGVCFHLISAWLVGKIASRVWRDVRAGWLAGGLYSIYPVAMWFSVQALDITFSIMLFLVAVGCFLEGRRETEQIEPGRKKGVWFVLCGLFAGLAVLARPNFLPPALILVLMPVLCAWVSAKWGGGRQGSITFSLPSVFAVGFALLAVLAVQGVINLRVGGEFRILPWQGAYNLYAGNREGANGKFYTQRVHFQEVPAGMNPARMESEFLYGRAAGGDAERSVDAMNAYWRRQLRENIAENPVGWLGLMGRKAVYLLNDWEQYNNLTYAFHKERFSVLRWNPLGWGVVMIGALVGLFAGFRRGSKADCFALFCLAGAYAVGVLLFFVSARFRIPLAPFLCVFMGGLIFATLSHLRHLGFFRGVVLCLGLLVVAVATYGNWFAAADRSSFIQDELLLASGSLEAGDDRLALRYSNAVLIRDATRGDAHRIKVNALFNLWLSADEVADRRSLWSTLEEALGEVAEPDASVLFIQGAVSWRQGDAGAAHRLWRSALERFGSAATSSAQALQATGAGTYFEAENSGVLMIRQILERPL